MFLASTEVQTSVTVLPEDVLSPNPVNLTWFDGNITGPSCHNILPFDIPILLYPWTDTAEIIETLRANTSLPQQLDNSNCIDQLQGNPNASYRNIFLLTDNAKASQTPAAPRSASLLDTYSGFLVCLGSGNCTESQQCLNTGPDPDNWLMPVLTRSPGPMTSPSETISNAHVRINRCVALSPEQICTVDVSRTLMSLVVVCSTVKLFWFVWLLFPGSHNPIVTIGDAISSFIQESHETTEGLSYLSFKHVRDRKWALYEPESPPNWTNDVKFWVYAIDPIQFGVTVA